MKLKRGTLVITQAGKSKPPRIQVKIDEKLFNLARGEVSQSVLDRLNEMNGTEVEFELVAGQPKQVREAGGVFLAPSPHAAGASQPARQAPDRKPAATAKGGDQSQAAHTRHFHNPYNFIPAPPRKTDDPDLGDSQPVSQDRYHPDRYTGRIQVQMTAITPLLVPDPEGARESDDGHLTFPVRVDERGKPLIAASSVRGMLRSAYEAITNSRFCRFSDAYKSRLAYRMEPKQGLGLIPARIWDGKIHLLTGTSQVGSHGLPHGPMYAAWLPRYRNGQLSKSALRFDDKRLPEHGEEVFCRLQRVRHRSGRFEYWKVSTIRPATGSRPAKDNAEVRGWVCVTNANINRKHDERVFFITDQAERLGPFPLTDELKNQWRELIENYQRLHEEEIARRRSEGHEPDEYLGQDPGQTAWSRHVYEKGYEELRDGTLCYARLSQKKEKVEALFPVMISRELYPCSPWDLLPPSLRPATRIEELSPADRVWGWVRTEPLRQEETQRTAARGLVRVGPVRCLSEDAIERFRSPLPLAILATPKPQQGRFYVAKDPLGAAQPDGLSKVQAGYAPKKGLRGRKVYPHHAGLPEHHWKDPFEDRTQNGPPYQEYRRPRLNGKEQQDSQNRSVEGWIKPGARFEFDLYLENLSQVELGALLWLLSLPDQHYLRFGGGRPLGFGSVRLEIIDSDLRTPEGLKSWYSSWRESQPARLSREARDAAVESFQRALARAYAPASGRFEHVPFIKAFLVACRGFSDGLPLHYPRVTPAPPPEGKLYEWFVQNERQGRYALPDLVNDKGLPILRSPQVGGD